MTAHDVPLVVDLDGTLIHSNLLHETASSYLVQSPHRIGHVAWWLGAGRARLKSELAGKTTLDQSLLPYRRELVEWITSERASGRRVVLATASTRQLAESVAAEVGLFDEVLASDGVTNLKGPAKRDELVRLFGAQGYDYVGDTRADVVVWASARQAHVVGDERLVAQARKVAEVGQVFNERPGSFRDLIRALRPHQWVKNLLILLPLMTAQLYDQRESVVAALLATVAFCVAASSVYLLNDIVDLGNDRQHPIKRRRPFAAGRVSLLTGWFLWPLLGVGSLVLGAVVSLPFFITLVGYLVLTVVYTFWGKRQPVVDVVFLGLLYTLRIIAGAAAIEAPLSIWLLTFSLLFFFSLALIKRVSELSRARADLSKTAGRGYRTSDIELLSSYGVASSIGAVVIFSLYVNDPVTADLYRTPEFLWATVPILLVWLMRSWLIAHRGEMNEDPILFAIRDRVSIFTGLVVVLAFALARIGV